MDAHHSQRMNPVSGALKFFATSLYNTLLAFVFFVVVAHYQSPLFVGRVAIIQLLEVVSGLTLALVPAPIYTREVAQAAARGEPDLAVVGSVLFCVLAASPALLVLLFFPSYLWLAIPYLCLSVYANTLQGVAGGRGRFTESAAAGAVFSTMRWGLSAIPAYLGSVRLLILVWLAGAFAKTLYLHTCLGRLSVRPRLDVLRRMFWEGLPVYVSGILSFVSSQGERAATALLLGSGMLGVYQLMALIASAPALLAGVFAGVLLPSASYYAAGGRSVPRMGALSLRVGLFIFGATATLSLYVGSHVIPLLFPAYAGGVGSFEVLVLATLVGAPFTSLYNFVVAKRGGLAPTIYISAGGAALMVAASFLLVPRMGIVGAAVSQALIQVFAACAMTVWALRVGAVGIGGREVLLIATYIVVCVLVYLHPLLFFLGFLPLLRFSWVVNREELGAIREFIPGWLRFVERALSRLV